MIFDGFLGKVPRTQPDDLQQFCTRDWSRAGPESGLELKI